MGEFVLESVVRGFHIYRAIWAGTLSCSTEPGNSSDAYAVGVKKDDNIVGHVPRKFSAIFALFLVLYYVVAVSTVLICRMEASKYHVNIFFEEVKSKLKRSLLYLILLY